MLVVMNLASESRLPAASSCAHRFVSVCVHAHNAGRGDTPLPAPLPPGYPGRAATLNTRLLHWATPRKIDLTCEGRDRTCSSLPSYQYKQSYYVVRDRTQLVDAVFLHRHATVLGFGHLWPFRHFCRLTICLRKRCISCSAAS